MPSSGNEQRPNDTNLEKDKHKKVVQKGGRAPPVRTVALGPVCRRQQPWRLCRDTGPGPPGRHDRSRIKQLPGSETLKRAAIKPQVQALMPILSIHQIWEGFDVNSLLGEQFEVVAR